MARLASLSGARIYFDANVAIYAVEKIDTLTPAHRALFLHFDSGALTPITSELTLYECLVKPFAEANRKLVDTYFEFFDPALGFECVGLTRPLLIEASRLRAALRLKTPDAIHVAAALATARTHFLTNDFRIRVPHGLTLLGWDDIEV